MSPEIRVRKMRALSGDSKRSTARRDRDHQRRTARRAKYGMEVR